MVERLLRQLRLRDEIRPVAPGWRARGQVPEQPLSLAPQRIMLNIAGSRHHHAGGPIIAVAPSENLFPRHASDQIMDAQNGPTEPMRAESSTLRQIEDQIVRRVAGRPDLLQDNVALALELVGIENRLGQDVGQDVEGLGPVVLEDAGIVGRGFHAGRRIYFAAGGFDLFRNGLGRAPLGSLEGHVLEEMGYAVLVRQFVAGTGLYPDAERHRLEMRHAMRYDMQTVIQTRNFNAHATPN